MIQPTRPAIRTVLHPTSTTAHPIAHPDSRSTPTDADYQRLYRRRRLAALAVLITWLALSIAAGWLVLNVIGPALQDLTQRLQAVAAAASAAWRHPLQ